MVKFYQSPSDYLKVKFDARHIFNCASVVDTFVKSIRYIGVEKVRSLHLSYKDKELIAYCDLDNRYVEIGENCWLSIPSTIKPIVKLLAIIKSLLGISMEITYFSQKDNMRYKAAKARKRLKDLSRTDLRTDLKFKINQNVYHSTYGQGKIMALPTTGKGYTVWFRYTEVKKVVDEKYLIVL